MKEICVLCGKKLEGSTFSIKKGKICKECVKKVFSSWSKGDK